MMAELTSYRCDECGRMKGESNHWYIAEHRPGIRTFIVAEWGCHNIVGEFKMLHLCGLPCAMKSLQKAMESHECMHEFY